MNFKVKIEALRPVIHIIVYVLYFPQPEEHILEKTILKTELLS